MASLVVEMCDVPFRYIEGEAALIYWTTLNGTVTYATVWPTSDINVGTGSIETLVPDYHLGWQAAARAQAPASCNFVELRFTNVLIKGGAAASTPGVLISTRQFDGARARASTRQHFISGDLFYSICIFNGCCARASIFGGINYTRITDEVATRIRALLADTPSPRDLFSRAKFQGGGGRFGVIGQVRGPWGVRLQSHLGLRAPIGRRSLRRRIVVGGHANPISGSDVALATGIDAKFSAAIQVLHCKVLYRLEIAYEAIYYFQLLNRRDLTDVRFSVYHAGRDIGFGGPVAALSVAF